MKVTEVLQVSGSSKYPYAYRLVLDDEYLTESRAFDTEQDTAIWKGRETTKVKLAIAGWGCTVHRKE